MRSRAQNVLLAACLLALVIVAASFWLERAQRRQPEPLAPLLAETGHPLPPSPRAHGDAGAARGEPTDGAQPSQATDGTLNDSAARTDDRAGAIWPEEKVQDLERRLDAFTAGVNAMMALEDNRPSEPEPPPLGPDDDATAHAAARRHWFETVLGPWQDRERALRREVARNRADLVRLYPEGITDTGRTFGIDWVRLRALAGRRLVIPARDNQPTPTRTPYNGPGS